MEVKEYKTQYSNSHNGPVKAYRCQISDGFIDIGGTTPTGHNRFMVAIGRPPDRILMEKHEWDEYKKLVDEWFENPFTTSDKETIPFREG